ncbi:hypothetical protein ABNQ39_20820 [Azospirillum sp. A26]|uniref:hypothetical protein n=1 Tax=Azospirillum sp. A26 TaxID=3160607 RepID=UPI00366F8F68
MGDIPRCPANGLERAAHFRKEAALHAVGGYWHSRLMATAICIEMRHQRDTGEPTLAFANPVDLLIHAATLRMAAADEDLPAARDEMIAWARQLEVEAMGGHVSPPQ